LARLQLGNRAMTDLLSGNVASGLVDLPAKGVMILSAVTDPQTQSPRST